MFGHKRLGAPVALSREEKEGMLKTRKENLVLGGVSSLASVCVWQEKVTENGIFIMAFLARIELMWNGLSFQWFALLQPSTCSSNVFHYNPINLA